VSGILPSMPDPDPKPDPNAPDPDEDDDGKKPDPDDESDDLQAQLDEAKREARSLRAKLAAAKRSTKSTEPTKSTKSTKSTESTDDDGPSEREAELERKLSKAEADLRSALGESIAASLDIVDPEAAVRLLDWESIEDPDDRSQVRAALKQLKKDRPYLARRVDTGAGAGGEDKRRTPSMNDQIRGLRG
jgi:chromosome segregation ATPase